MTMLMMFMGVLITLCVLLATLPLLFVNSLLGAIARTRAAAGRPWRKGTLVQTQAAVVVVGLLLEGWLIHESDADHLIVYLAFLSPFLILIMMVMGIGALAFWRTGREGDRAIPRTGYQDHHLRMMAEVTSRNDD